LSKWRWYIAHTLYDYVFFYLLNVTVAYYYLYITTYRHVSEKKILKNFLLRTWN
jgi:hypothetical protein